MPIVSSSTSSPIVDDSDLVHPEDTVDAPPPFLGSWRNVYLLLIGELTFLVLAFWLLGRWAS